MSKKSYQIYLDEIAIYLTLLGSTFAKYLNDNIT